MKKTKSIISLIVCSFLICLFPINVEAKQQSKVTHEPSQETTVGFFNLNDSNEQNITVIDEQGECYNIKMLPNLGKEYLPIGSFNRKFEATGYSTTMSAYLAGTTNPYISTISSVSNGSFYSSILTWLKDSYFIDNDVTNSNSSPAEARYTATFTSYLGNTATRSLRFSLYLNGYIEVKVTYG